MPEPDPRSTQPATRAGDGVPPTAPMNPGRLPPGTMVGPHRVEEVLGEGGMAVVYRATDTRLGRSVALKVMGRSLAGNGEAERRFLREARMLAGVSHPNLVCVYEAGESPAGPYLVMELLAGETLAGTLARGGPLEPARARGLVRRLAEALAACHARGVVHRDVKPSNVLLVPDRGPVLADFGLARPAEGGLAITAPGLVFGTPEYMSPEQARGEILDARSDLYALGILWYELLSGAPPFTGKNVASILKQQVQALPPPLPAGVVPAGSERALLLSCLEKDREKRPAGAGALAAALAALELPGAVVRPSLPPERKRRARIRIPAMVLAFLVLGIAGYRMAARQGSRPLPAEVGPDRVSRWLAEPDLAAFLAGFAPGPLRTEDRVRVERDLARSEAGLMRLAAAPSAFPETGQIARRKLLERAARDLCILGRPREASALLAEALAAARGADRVRLARLARAVDEPVHKEASGR